MEISKQTKKHLIQIIAFAVLLYCGIEHFDVIVQTIRFITGILMPFIIGCIIAFILNVPMKKIEKHLFTKNEKMRKFRRPLAYVLTLLCVIGIIVLASVVVIPELGNTIAMIAEQIPVAVKNVQRFLMELPDKFPALAPAVEELDIDWSSFGAAAVDFVQNLATGTAGSNAGLFSGIVNGVSNFVIGFIFSIYVLFQKEKLASQAKQILYALLPDRTTEKVISVAKLSNQIFTNFLSGQCLEAVILGTMFVVAMTILRLPYAMLMGIVIGITALIPVVGAFVGCVIGVILILMVDPIKAVWFLVLFLVLQQIEGNVIYPRVVGGSIGLPAIWVLAAVSIGGSLFGMAGILFFIPLCSVCYALFRTFIKKRLVERDVPETKWKAQD